MRPVIRFDGVAKRFESGPPWRRRVVEALAETSFALDSGETAAVVGESGSGKSTLARLCLGLLYQASLTRTHGPIGGVRAT